MKAKKSGRGVIRTLFYPKIKNETNVINLDEYKSIGTHWMAVYVNDDNVLYFDSSFES